MGITANFAPRLMRLAIVLALVCLATSAVWFTLQTPKAGIDDANIFFAYAQNLSAGKGFVFNSEGERVEGFTSLAWVLICTAAYRIAGAPEPVLLVVNVLLVTLTIICCVAASTLSRQSDAATHSRTWAAVFLVLLLSDFSYVTWSTVTFMETALWTALLTLSALFVLDGTIARGHAYAFAAVSAFMVFTRPEALVWAPLMVLLFYVNRRTAHGPTLALRSAAPAAVGFVLTAGLMTVFRVWYFGYPLPNTYLREDISVVQVSHRGGRRIPLGIPLIGAGGARLLRGCPRFRRPSAHDEASRHAHGGLERDGGRRPDLTRLHGRRSFRGLSILSTRLSNLPARTDTRPSIYCAADLPQHPGRAAKAALVTAALVLTGIVLVSRIADWKNFERRTAMRREFSIAEMGRDRGGHAERLFAGLQQRPSIGTITVGGLRDAYSGDVIDLMGLNNTRMAHNNGTRVGIRSHAAFEKRTFYELSPMLVLPLVQYSDLTVQATRIWFVDVALKGLVDDKPFRDRYRLAEVRRATPSGDVAVAGWYDRAFLGRLSQLKEFRITESPTLPD